MVLAELAVGFAGFSEKYVSEVRSWKPERGTKAIVEAIAADASLFKSMRTTWTFEAAQAKRLSFSPIAIAAAKDSNSTATKSTTDKDAERAPTLVNFEIQFAFNNPLHAAAASAFFDGVSKDVMRAFERRCRDVYGAGKM